MPEIIHLFVIAGSIALIVVAAVYAMHLLALGITDLITNWHAREYRSKNTRASNRRYRG